MKRGSCKNSQKSGFFDQIRTIFSQNISFLTKISWKNTIFQFGVFGISFLLSDNIWIKTFKISKLANSRPKTILFELLACLFSSNIYVGAFLILKRHCKLLTLTLCNRKRKNYCVNLFKSKSHQKLNLFSDFQRNIDFILEIKYLRILKFCMSNLVRNLIVIGEARWYWSLGLK